MTSMVVLDSGQSLSEKIPKKLHNRIFTRQELLNLAIVKSDNNAARMLCEYYPGGIKNCVEAMNNKANALGMNNSTFTDPTGLYNTNRLVGTGVDFIVSKTGWITASGGCIVMMLKGEQGIRTVVLLGSKNTKTRIPEAYMVSKLH
jgi:D-alanyl-D-alanine carboxypeptidase